MTFYERYATVCLSRGIEPCSQKAADLFRTTRATLSTWNTKGTTPKGDTVLLIADTLGVSADYLLGRTDDQTDHTTHPGTATPAPTHPIAAMFDQLDKVDQARVEAYIVSILESEKYNDQKKKRHA